MGKRKSKKKTKKRKAKKPRIKGPLWKVYLYKFLFGDDAPGEQVRKRIAKRGGLVAKRLLKSRG